VASPGRSLRAKGALSSDPASVTLLSSEFKLRSAARGVAELTSHPGFTFPVVRPHPMMVSINLHDR
jgi:hypothetical protein